MNTEPNTAPALAPLAANTMDSIAAVLGSADPVAALEAIMATLTTDQQAVLHAHLALQAVHVRRAPTVRVYEADPGTQQASLDELFSVIHNPSANVGMPLRDRQLPPSFWTPPQLMQTSSDESNQSRSRSGSGNPPTPTSPVTAKTSPRTPRQRKPRMCCACFCCQCD